MTKTICIAGKNEIAVFGMELAIKIVGKNNVCVCPNQNDDGRTTWQPSLRRFAQEFGVDVYELKEIKRQPDIVFLSLEFDRIIKPIEFASKKLYNIHFSLLPAYKGVYTAAWPILNGEINSGVTLHEIDNGIDTGPILAQREFIITRTCTARDVYLNCMSTSISLLSDSLPLILENRISGSPQPHENSTYYSRKSIDYSNPTIETLATALQIQRRIRALHFREFQIPTINGFPVSQTEIQESRSEQQPGTLVAIDNDSMKLATVDFDIICRRDRSQDFLKMAETNDYNAICNYPYGNEHIDTTNAKGWSPLMISAYNGYTYACEALLKRGARVDLTNPNGTSALMFAKDYALLTGDISPITTLLKYNSSPNQVDRFGLSVLDYLYRLPNDTLNKDTVIRAISTHFSECDTTHKPSSAP